MWTMTLHKRWTKFIAILVIFCVAIYIKKSILVTRDENYTKTPKQVSHVVSKESSGKTVNNTTNNNIKNMYNITKPSDGSIYNKKGLVVLIMAYYRSGSTFFGNLFSNNPGAFYLFEPLAPFGAPCEGRVQNFPEEVNVEATKFITNISHCDFRVLPGAYKRAYSRLMRKYNSDCETNVCFNVQNKRVIDKIKKVCTVQSIVHKKEVPDKNLPKFIEYAKKMYKQESMETPEICQRKMSPKLESGVCYTSSFVAFKLIRLCNTSQFESIYHDLTALGNDVYVLHLVRDPRAIISSTLDVHEHNNSPGEYARKLCRNMKKFLDFERKIKDEKAVIPKSNHMRVSFEDFSLKIHKTSSEIYSLIKLPIPPELEEWIEEMSYDPQELVEYYKKKINATYEDSPEWKKYKSKLVNVGWQVKNSFATIRSAEEVLKKWRKKLTFADVIAIQDQCEDVLSELGYLPVTKAEELKSSKIGT